MKPLNGSEKPDLSIITTCKGRLKHLKQSFHRLCQLSFAGRHVEYVLVDYDDPDRCGDWLMSQDAPDWLSLTVHRMEDRPIFNVAHARNVGAVNSLANFLFFMDADCLLTEEWVAEAIRPVLLGYARYSHVRLSPKATEKFGAFCVTRTAYEAANGYDEAFNNWGHEDDDMYDRVGEKYSPPAVVDPDKIEVIRHGNDLRVRFYEDKRIASYGKPASNSNNAKIKANRSRTVNPNGHGKADIKTRIKWKPWLSL